jgi:hypothetical protein
LCIIKVNKFGPVFQHRAFLYLHYYKIINMESLETTAHFAPEKPPTIAFHNKAGGDMIGKLYIEDGKLHFEGNAAESAQIFFDEVLSRFNKNE